MPWLAALRRISDPWRSFTSRRALTLALTAMLAASLAHPMRARAQYADPDFWCVDGLVNALLLDGNTLYAGGSFTHLGHGAGGLLALDASGAPRSGWPAVNGIVLTIAPDGSGGWYVGGMFTNVAGVPRANLAHIRGDGSLDGWNPGADSYVTVLAVANGVVWAGGNFAHAGGQARSYLAAIDATTGLATAAAPNPDFYVEALAVSGSTLYVGGSFSNIGAATRNYLAALDATSGVPNAWDPEPNGYVQALAVAGGTVYAGGNFTMVSGLAHLCAAAIDATNGTPSDWNPSVNGTVYAFAVAGGTVYLGGEFTTVGGQGRSFLAAVSSTTASPTAWNPGADGQVYGFAIGNGCVYVTGNFNHTGGAERSKFAAIDPVSGLASPQWNPLAQGVCSIGGTAVVVSGSSVFAASRGFVTGPLVERHGLAAIDLVGGGVTSFDAGLAGTPPTVDALALDSGSLYIGGLLTGAGGLTRGNLAAVNATSGAVTSWNPGANAEVFALAVYGSRVYVAGMFTNCGATPRNYLAAVDRASGLAVTWDAAMAGQAYLGQTLCPYGNTMIVGGVFTSIGGQPRNAIAAIDTSTGLATTWNPLCGGSYARVMSVVPLNGTLYIGGYFTSMGGYTRSDAAASDLVTGNATSWNPSTSSYVTAIAPVGSYAYLGGYFTTAGGAAREHLAVVDLTSGALGSWNPGADGSVYALVPVGSSFYVGGSYTRIGGLGTIGLACLRPPDTQAPSVTVLRPNGGESVTIGSTVHLAGTPVDDNLIASVDVYLSRSGPSGPWQLLAAGLVNPSGYDWTVTGPASTNAYVRIDARDDQGNVGTDLSNAAFTIGTGAAGVDAATPAAFAIEPLANPACGTLAVTYALPRACAARVALCDVQGREVAVLAQGEAPAGRHTAALAAGTLAPGLYFVRLAVPSARLERRIVLLR